MNRTTSSTVIAVIATLGVAGTTCAEPVQVDIYGTVIFNGITAPNLGLVTPGQTAHVSFELDSNLFVNSIPGDVRGYDILPGTFDLSFSGGVSVGLLAPPAYFGVVEGFPVSDGFFVSSSAFGPGGVPLTQAPYQLGFNVGYVGSTLSSLDILSALGTYNFTGLTNFGFTLWAASPDNVLMEIDFSHMTIAAVPGPASLAAFLPLAWGCGRRRRE